MCLRSRPPNRNSVSPWTFVWAYPSVCRSKRAKAARPFSGYPPIRRLQLQLNVWSDTRSRDALLLFYKSGVWFTSLQAAGVDNEGSIRRLRRSTKFDPLGGELWRALEHGRIGRIKEEIMKTWTKPAVREQEVGLEVTSYLPAEIDII